MRVTTRTFWLPKAGNSDEEYEDAFWPPEGVDDQPLRGFRCAIADGATETSFSGAWAQLLTRHWCEVQNLDSFRAALPALQEEWGSQIGSVPMAWYAEEKARAGAYSSLLALDFSGETPGNDSPINWTAVAVGDSCLFRIRGGGTKPFPLNHSDEFNSRPYLLSTTSMIADDLSENLLIESGSCMPGDVFYLMTDALACWFLRRHEEGQNIAESLLDLDGPEMFQRIVDGQRAVRDPDGQPYLRNDDVTLYRLEIHE